MGEFSIVAVPALYRTDLCTRQGHGVKAADTQICFRQVVHIQVRTRNWRAITNKTELVGNV